MNNINKLNCKHCGGEVNIGDKNCANCGIPLPPDLGKHPQRKFILFFIAVVIFCLFMIYWLPPNWMNAMGKN